VLIVDDESAICDTTRRTLERYGYTVLQAGNGLEGLAQFSNHRKDIRVVVTDLIMPGMDGVLFSRVLRAMAPQVPIIVASGGLFDKDGVEALRAFEQLGRIRVVHKPHTADVLLRAVSDLLPQSVGSPAEP